MSFFGRVLYSQLYTAFGWRLGMGMGESVTAVAGFPVPECELPGLCSAALQLECLNDCIRVTSFAPNTHTYHHFLWQAVRKITGKNKKVAYWYLNSVARLRAAPGWDTRSSNSTKTWSQMTSDSWYLRQIATVNHEQRKRPHEPDRQRPMNQDHSGSLSAKSTCRITVTIKGSRQPRLRDASLVVSSFCLSCVSPQLFRHVSCVQIYQPFKV